MGSRPILWAGRLNRCGYSSSAGPGGWQRRIGVTVMPGFWSRINAFQRRVLQNWLFALHRILGIDFPQWVNEAASALPLVDYIAAFFVAVGILVSAALSNAPWLEPVALWAGVLSGVLCTLHWRANYVREIKHEQRQATHVVIVAVLVFMFGGTAIVVPILRNIAPIRVNASAVRKIPVKHVAAHHTTRSANEKLRSRPVVFSHAYTPAPTANPTAHIIYVNVTPRPTVARPRATPSPPNAPPTSTPSPVPVTHITFTQNLIGQKNPGYPYVLQVVVQTDHTISPLKLAVLFQPGAELDANSVLGYGAAQGGTMLLTPRSGYGVFKNKWPFIMVQCECTPALSPEIPYIITVQSKAYLSVQAVLEPVP
jgi:hypothetical protein